MRVSVFDGTTDGVKTYPVDVLTDNFVGAGECTPTRCASPGSPLTGPLPRLPRYSSTASPPGGLASINGERSDAGTTGVISWTPPAWWGSGIDPGYTVKVTESSTGRVLVDTTTSDTSVTVPQIDPGLQYVAKVTPINSYGGCFTSSQVLRAGNRRRRPQEGR